MNIIYETLTKFSREFSAKKFKVRNFGGSLAVLILLAAILACSKFERPSEQQYRKDGVAFTHLSSWKINEDQASTAQGVMTRYLTVEGPGNAVFLLSRFPSQIPTTLEEYAETLHKAMSEGAKDMTGGYEIVEMGAAKTSPVAARIAGIERQGLLREFDLKALGVPVPHHAEYYLIETATEKCFVVAQSPTENWNSMRDGLQIIFDSLSIGEVGAGGGK